MMMMNIKMKIPKLLFSKKTGMQQPKQHQYEDKVGDHVNDDDEDEDDDNDDDED